MIFEPQLSKSQTTYWKNLPGASSPLAISSLYASNDKPLLVITSTILEATQLQKALAFFIKPPLEENVFVFPDRETLPYDQLSPHKDITSARLKLLLDLNHLKKYICIVSVNTLLGRLPPKIYLEQNTLQLSIGESLSLENFKLHCETIGYHNTNQVIEHGEYCVKGGIIDIFPMGHTTPFRIELFNNEIESIRIFDPETQLSIEKINNINLMPATEYPLTEKTIKDFQDRWKSKFDLNPKLCPIYQAVKNFIQAPGAEYYLPLFFDQTNTLLDFISADSIIIQHQDIYSSCKEFSSQAFERFESINVDKYRSILPPNEAFLTSEELFQNLKKYHNVKILDSTDNNKHGIDFNCSKITSFNIDVHKDKPMNIVSDFIEQTTDKVLIVAESQGRREIVSSLLEQSNIIPTAIENWHQFTKENHTFAITTGSLVNGAKIQTENMTIISENELFGYQAHSRTTNNKFIDSKSVFKNLVELEIGSLVVHIEYGIAKYQGLKLIESKNETTEFLCLEFYDDAMIYVPITSLNLITRYNGLDPDNVTLSKLGTTQWKKVRETAIKQLQDVAAELLDIYAKRKQQTGIKFSINRKEYLNFCAKFEFEETVDQTRAFLDVQNDMNSHKIMDRLICGDVGFGKTEIAMRAAFIAIHNKKQVAILVPTTLLASQHYQNFIDRFSGFDIKIECLSRFKSAMEKKLILKDIKNGVLDIVIGTHSLLQPTVTFNNLGLLVIDEEHRFGVKQKEFIKASRNKVDILSLTATPIPRTLNMSLHGIRDISILATPPLQRLSIKTFIQQKSKSIIREGIMRELLRGGQVFYLHNNVQTMQATLNFLNELVPEAKIQIAHGQLPEKQLEQIMSDFYHAKFNILLCTTIIETGLDIPSTNTIIIDRADRFGLAQLYQLRGRVGRSHHQAYAYLILPDEKVMTKDAIKRIEALSSLNTLGSGFTLASHDLDIRGSGEILGKEQSGNIQKIGFSLYAELLDQTVKALKNGKLNSNPLKIFETCEINLKIPALIPEEYIYDVKDRLVIYKKIASATTSVELDNIQVELIDRFGLMPAEVQSLFKVSLIKQQAASLDIKKIDVSSKGGYILFKENPNINKDATLDLVMNQPKIYQLIGPSKLSFTTTLNSEDKKIELIDKLFKTMKADTSKSIN